MSRWSSTRPTRSSELLETRSGTGSDRALRRDTHARGPPVRTRPPRARARSAGVDSSGCGGGVPARRAEDGDEIEVGQRACARTPHAWPPAGAHLLRGHRPLAGETRRGSCSQGDSLFVGDAARPDLAVGRKEGAEGLFHSLQRLLELADGIEVFPGHVAGSLCGKGMSSKGSSTIGFERRFNPALQIGSEGRVRRRARWRRPPKPPNMARIVELNRGPFVGPPSAVAELGGADGLDRARRPAGRRLPRGTRRRGPERAGLGRLLRDEGRLSCSTRKSRWSSRRRAARRPRGRSGASGPSAFSTSTATCSVAAPSRWRL